MLILEIESGFLCRTMQKCEKINDVSALFGLFKSAKLCYTVGCGSSGKESPSVFRKGCYNIVFAICGGIL